MAKDTIISGVLVCAREFSWNDKPATATSPAKAGGRSYTVVVADPDEWGTDAEVQSIAVYGERAALFHQLRDSGFGARVVLRCGSFAAARFDERLSLIEVVSIEAYGAPEPTASNGRKPATV